MQQPTASRQTQRPGLVPRVRSAKKNGTLSNHPLLRHSRSLRYLWNSEGKA
jgi:hypothetical protein